MTNFEKLVRWDADWYKSLGSDDCIVCLSEKQIYLVLMAIDPMTWVRTRWTGDLTGLDLEGIKGGLVYALTENMSCDALEEILTRLKKLEVQVTTIYNETIEGDTTITGDTILNDVFSPDDQLEPLHDISGCDNDVIYGMVTQLVSYIHNKNVDFLEQVSQAGNIGTVLDFLQDAGLPGIAAVLPTDEAAGYAAFLLEELLQEYETTVTEELLQQTRCDLFCIATAGASCNLDYADLINYFASHVDPSLSTALGTLDDLVQFAISGTMSGDMYFYFACYFQLWAVYAGERFFGIEGSFETYAQQAAAGANSPDADWEIFCDPCAAVYWYHTHDFVAGLGQWEIITGTLVGDRVVGVDVGGGSKQATIKLTTPTRWKLNKTTVLMDRIGILSGSDFTRIRYYDDYAGAPGTFTQWQNHTFEPNGTVSRCAYSAIGSSGDPTTITITCAAQGTGSHEVEIRKVELWGTDNMDYGVYEPDAPTAC